MKEWTEEEIQILKDNYTDKGVDVTLQLLERFSRTEINRMAKSLDLKRKKRKPIQWSDEDNKKFIELYPHMLNSDLIKEFPHLDLDSNALRRHANKLGIKKTEEALELTKEERMRKRKDGWSDEEVEILKKNYSTHGIKGCMLLIDRTRQAISHKAKELGLWGTIEKSWMMTDINFSDDDLFAVKITYKRTDVIEEQIGGKRVTT